MRRYIGVEVLRQSRLTVIDGDGDSTSQEALPALTA
jgi:hypothetical protein